MKFIIGETVRITDRFAAARSKGSHLNWRNRIGTVKASTNYVVYVVWDGTVSAEALLLKAVERYERDPIQNNCKYGYVLPARCKYTRHLGCDCGAYPPIPKEAT